MNVRSFATAAVALSSAALLAAGAWAQSAKDESVLGRPRPDYSPIGVEIGGGGLFILYPRITGTLVYDDNIYREEESQSDDLLAIVQPELRLESDWDSHALNAGIAAAIGRHFQESRANYEDWLAFASGRVDITEDSSASGEIEYARQHEDRGDPDSAGRRLSTIQFDRLTRRLGLDFRGSPIFARTTAEWTSFNYHDEDGLNYDDRDYNYYETRLRLGAEVSPSVSVFVEPGYNWRVYDGLDDFGFDNDSHGYDVRAGVTYDVTAVTFLELFGGYFNQRYDDGRFDPVSGVGFGAELTWNPNDVMTVTGTVGRTVHETGVRNASGLVDTGVDLRVDYELLENLIGSAHASVHHEDFEGIRRADNVEVVGVGLTYFVNPYLSGGLDYAYGERNSHHTGEDYRFNRVMLRVSGAL